jgi:hypothetical protein
MSTLGIPFLIKKHKARYTRANNMRKYNNAKHYTLNKKMIVGNYNKSLKKSHNLRCNKSGYCFTRRFKRLVESYKNYIDI